MPVSNHTLSHSSFHDSEYDEIERSRSYIDEINIDLLRSEQLLESSDSRIPILDDSYVHDMWSGGDQYRNLEVQSSMDKPYLLLEFVASTILDVVLCSNDLMFSIISDAQSNTDPLVRYIVAKLINLSFVAMIPFIFTTADTYKSINVTVEYLAINVIIFEYDFANILKFAGIQLLAAILGSLISYGIYFEYVKHLTSEQILPNIVISAFTFKFNISYVIVSILVHVFIAAGLTIISNNASSMNAKKKTLHKSLLFMFAGLSFGLFVGPVGHMVPQIIFYAFVVVLKGDFHLFNENMFITYSVAVLFILILYPLIAIQIKFYWRNRYKRYIEYGSWR